MTDQERAIAQAKKLSSEKLLESAAPEEILDKVRLDWLSDAGGLTVYYAGDNFERVVLSGDAFLGAGGADLRAAIDDAIARNSQRTAEV